MKITKINRIEDKKLGPRVTKRRGKPTKGFASILKQEMDKLK